MVAVRPTLVLFVLLLLSCAIGLSSGQSSPPSTQPQPPAVYVVYGGTKPSDIVPHFSGFIYTAEPFF